MKFAIAIENTDKSKDLLNNFIKKISFCPNFTLDIYVIQEAEWQEESIKKLNEYLFFFFKKNKINGEIIVESSDPIYKVVELIKKRKVNVFVAYYEKSIMKKSFFENVLEEIDIPIMVIRR